ncbi:MAG: gliding motility-associated C-terminal domain-containing protein, partial [Bacteroidia bacterium]|nr:gliding motility-associated C-terminal domain-containing protein [Bacteroidia bacterium]
SEVPDIPELEFIDNCSASVNVYFYEEIISNTTNEFSYDVLRTWTVIDECANTSIFTQTIHMIVEYEENYESIELCIDEEAIYLNDFVDLNENGVWESESMDVLNNMVFDPYVMPEGDYTFKYTVEDNECIYIKDIFINVNDDCIEYPCIRSINDVDISVLVTPNGDLKNETFNVSYTLNPNIDDELACDIKTVVKLFNRWGTKVYESNDYQNTWRGESPTGSLGNSEKLPTGTYYYVVDLVNSGLKPIQGYILLGVEDK